MSAITTALLYLFLLAISAVVMGIYDRYRLRHPDRWPQVRDEHIPRQAWIATGILILLAFIVIPLIGYIRSQ